MTNRMTITDRYADISKRCGLSENVVKRVLAAQADSIVDSLKHGETATIPQICTLEPDIRKALVKECLGEKKFIHVRALPLISLREKLSAISEYEEKDTSDEEENIRVSQIGSLM